MSEPFVGEIRMFAGNFAPSGWDFCSGQILPITQSEALFNLLGTVYGGDGVTTFALPDLRGRFPLHLGLSPVSGVVYHQGQLIGSESVVLTTNELPSHRHTANANPTGSVVSPQGAVWSTDPGGNTAAYTASSNGTMSQNAIGDVIAAQPHDNMQPFLGINFIISLFGIYPSQS